MSSSAPRWLKRALPTIPARIAEAPTTPPTPNTPGFYRVTLTRSAIGLPSRYRDTLKSMGLNKRMATVLQRHTPEAAGRIMRVKELVRVENVYGEGLKEGRVKREHGLEKGWVELGKVREFRGW